MKYKIAIHRTDEGISVSVPALPGCWSEGDTEEEAIANIQDAIRGYLAALNDSLQGAEVREVEVQTGPWPEAESSARPDIPERHTIHSETLASFLRGVGSVLEINPPPDRLDAWRVSQDIPLHEWPLTVRALLTELQEDAASRGTPS